MHDTTVYFSGLLRFPLKKCVGVPSSAAAEGEEAAAAAPDENGQEDSHTNQDPDPHLQAPVLLLVPGGPGRERSGGTARRGDKKWIQGG